MWGSEEHEGMRNKGEVLEASENEGKVTGNVGRGCTGSEEK